MKIRSIAAAAFLCFASIACVQEGSDSDQVEEGPMGPDKAADPESFVVDTDVVTQYAADPSNCEVAPDPGEPDGPCSFACEPDRLVQFVSPNTCMTFLCYKWDGSPAKVGTCND